MDSQSADGRWRADGVRYASSLRGRYSLIVAVVFALIVSGCVRLPSVAPSSRAVDGPAPSPALRDRPAAVVRPAPPPPAIARPDVIAGAFLASVGDSDPDCAVLGSQLTAALRLAPEFIVFVGDASVSESGEVSCGGRPLPSLPIPDSTRVYTVGTAAASGLPHAKVVLADGTPLIFMRRQGLSDAPDETVSWLSRQVRGADPSGVLLLVWDLPPWADATREAWESVEGVLFGLQCRVYVLSGGVDRFSWWRQDNIQTLCLGPARAVRDLSGTVADGRVNGLVWLRLSGGEADFRVLEPEALSPPQVFDRQLQQERAALSRAVSASSVGPSDLTTTVRCQNPSSRVLEFQTAWRFEDLGSLVEVDPQVLGFTLRPGQDFVQDFRFRQVNGVPLKFLRPAFHVKTEALDGLGRRVPVEIAARPVVRMSGSIVPLGEGIAVDGLLNDWPLSGAPVNNRSQVVRGADSWGGPEDLSGVLHVGFRDRVLYVALLLADDQCLPGAAGHSATASIHVDCGPQGLIQGVTRESTLLTVTGDCSGRAQASGGLGGSAATVSVAAARTAQPGFALEAALPFSAFAGGRPGSVVRVEAVLEQTDSNEGCTVLCFSGTLEGLSTGRYFAEFAFPESEAERAP